MSEKTKFEAHYGDKKRREELAWHHADPTRFLSDIVQTESEPGTALDMGCGTGVDSVYLAKHGWKVTSLDFMQKALDMSKELAEQESVGLNLVCTDVLEWNNSEKFDLLLDSGLLHNMPREKIPSYKARILSWLKPGGDFVLAHWESRWDYDRFFRGPRRATKEQIIELLGPELGELKMFDRKEARMCKVCEGTRCDHNGQHCRGVGPDVSIAYYWFQHKLAQGL